MRVALDTNILAYAEGVGDGPRVRSARTLIARLPGEAVLVPAQVLGELHRVLVGKAGRPPEAARTAVLGWADAFDVAETTDAALRAALDLAADHRLGIWDSLILAVAAEQRCRLLLSVDLQDGFTWRGLTVIDPFRPRAHALLAALLA